MKIRKVKGVVILRLSSSDLYKPKETLDIVEDLLQIDGERKFVIDVSSIKLLASLQIGTLVTLHLTCYENVAVMKLTGLSESNNKVLKLVGLDKLMEIHHGTEIARASFDNVKPEKKTNKGTTKVTRKSTRKNSKSAKSSTKKQPKDN